MSDLGVDLGANVYTGRKQLLLGIERVQEVTK